ncbi:TIGR02646 family protein [Lachnospiraceae bacterium MD335]|nr:TIGR02646 family protein [Lachnospiraceae bacterium MD335]
MIYIQKKSEPNLLLEYRHQMNARFDDMDSDVKNQLRESLLKEQGHLCAYCMKRIADTKDIKIEHFEARTLENELNYHNLLAVCKGGEGGPVQARSCDTKKENRPIFINPLNKSDMNRIYYNNSGEIHSSDTTEYEFEYYDSTGKYHSGYTSPEQDIHVSLNLNYENGAPLLGRKTALRKFQQLLHPYKDKKSKRLFLEKMQRVYSEQSEYMEPYVGIVRWYIEKKLNQL